MPSTSLVCLFLLCHKGVCLAGLEKGRHLRFERFAIVSIWEGNEYQLLSEADYYPAGSVVQWSRLSDELWVQVPLQRRRSSEF